MDQTGFARHQLAWALSGAVREWQAQPDEYATVNAIVRTAAAAVPQAGEAGLSQLTDRRGEDVVATSAWSHQCENLHAHLRDGPCATALREHQTIMVDDMPRETRWPRFANHATELGVSTLASFPLCLHQDTLGALTIYGTPDSRFDSETQLIGEILAGHAAVALSAARTHRQLSTAVTSRDMIGQAKGLLMCRQNLTSQQAFDTLRGASQDTNVKLIDLAQQLHHEHNHQAAHSANP